MKILFLGCFYPQELVDLFKASLKSASLQNAPNVFQHALLKGFDENNQKIDFLTIPALGCYPLHYKKIYTPSRKIQLSDNVQGEVVGYCTIPLLKKISIRKKIYSKVLKWIVRNQSCADPLWILSYTPQSDFLQPLSLLKNKFPQLHIGTVVTDLVDDMLNFSSNRTPLKRLQVFIEQREVKSLYKSVDKFILLTKPMVEKIPQSQGKNIVIEGISDYDFSFSVSSVQKKEKIILYAGTLEEYSGVRDLIDAFRGLNDENCKLVICGSGILNDFIIANAKLDGRIIFRGRISREEVLLLQKKASVLINPRKPDNKITKYSFPSKTMEYLTSGTPMVGYRLEGIPQEYFDYFFSPLDESVEAMSDVIRRVLSMSTKEMECVTRKAYEFIKKEKNSKKQTSKILEFLR